MLTPYFRRRLLFMALTLWVVVTITFFLSYLIPGDPARLIAGATASTEQVELVRHELGLDQPAHVQYGRYIARLLRGDLGMSLQSRRDVSLDIRDYFGATLELSTCALLLTLVLGIPLGVLSAVYRDRTFDHANRLLSLSGVSLPVFWLALLMQLLFSQVLDLLPLGGRVAAGSAALPHYTGLYSIDSLIMGDWARFKDVIVHLILPSVCVAYPSLATVTRMVRANMLEVLQEDYLRTARAYGLPSSVIYFRHALKNAMLPTITVIGLVYGYTLGGSLLAEMIFFWPGLGRYAAFAIINSDYPAIMGVTLTIAVTYMALNLIVDLAYGFFDPRIRVRG